MDGSARPARPRTGAAAFVAAVLCPLNLAAATIPGPVIPEQSWRGDVVYQVYPRSFADGNDDGVGDLQGITAHVDYFHELGVDMVWICPVNRTTNYDNGYDVSDYLDIDPTFGTLADWEKLRDALHARGIKIMMDLVLNHSSDAHPWFEQEVYRKALQARLPVRQPSGSALSEADFRRGMRAALTGAPPPAGVDVAAEPFATAALRARELREATGWATQLGYPPAQEQLERLGALVYGDARESRAARAQNEDFYIWRDRPNNWTSIFSGSAWHFVEPVGAYYLALFSLHQPDLNWSNPRLRQVMYGTVRTWVERGVDGFRLDSVGFLGKHPAFPDAPKSDTARNGRGMQYFVNQPQVHDYLRELHHEALAGRDIRTVGEVSFSPPAVSLDYAGSQRRELTEVFLFDHMYVDVRARDKWSPIPLQLVELKKIIGDQQATIHGRAWVANYLENHDQLRAVSRFGDDQRYRAESAKMLATLLLTLEGTPYIYQGQEIGMTNGNFTRIEEVDDIEARNYYAAAIHAGDPPAAVMAAVAARNRDNVRTVMQWDASKFAGFSEHVPWIKVNANAPTVNVARERADPHSVLAYYRALIRLRRGQPPLITGRYVDLLPADPHLFVYTRTLGERTALVLLNFSAVPQTVPRPLGKLLAGTPRLLIGNYPPAGDAPAAAAAPGEAPRLGPFEARVYVND